MTGYTVHTGSNDKFAAGWDQVFSGAGKSKKKANQTTAERKAEKKSASKKAAKGDSKEGKKGK